MGTNRVGSQDPNKRPLATTNLGLNVLQEWEHQLLERLLSQLGDSEHWLLTALAVLNEPFWWRIAYDWLSTPQLLADHIQIPLDLQSLLIQWHNLSLLQFHHTDEAGNFWYRVHPMAREVLMDRLEAGRARAFHKQAAAFYAAPFIAEARRFLAAQSGPGALPSQEECESLARHPRGPIFSWTHQAENPRLVSWTMERALKWQERLFLAEEYEPANDLVAATWAVLARWGQKERARALLERSIGTVYGLHKAAAQANLATLLRQTGQPEAAREIFEQVIPIFSHLGAREQQSAALSELSALYRDAGRLNLAFDRLRAALEIRRDIDDEEGQAASLEQLATLYLRKRNLRQALEHIQAAEAIIQKLARKNRQVLEAQFARILSTHGNILGQMHQYPAALACFEQSLEINQRTADRSNQAEVLLEMGKALAKMGELERATEVLRLSTELRSRLKDPDIGANFQAMGTVYEKGGDYRAALEQYQQGRRLFQDRQPAALWGVRGQIWRVNFLVFRKALIERFRRLIDHR